MCKKCAVGYYASSVGATKCQPCLPGYYNSLEAQKYCSPCETNEYTNKTASVACMDCPSLSYCSVATAEPIAYTVNNVSSAITHDPYFSSAIDAQAATSAQSNSARIAVVCIAAGLLIIVGLIGFCCLFASSKIPTTPKVRTITSICDLFKLRHYTRLNQPLLKKATYLGIFFSFMFIIIGSGVLSVLLVDFIINNVVDRQSIVPEQTLPTSMERRIVGNYSFLILMHNFNDKDCNNGLVLATGIVPHVIANATLLGNFTCRISVQCNACYLDGSQQTIDMNWNSVFASSNKIELYFFMPHYTPGKFFFVYEALLPPTADSIFKGPDATQIALTLTRTYHTVLPADFFFNSLLTRRSGNSGTTTSGYIASKFPTRLGSTVTSSTFFSKNGLRIIVTLASDPNVFRIEQESLASILELLSKMVALLSAVFTILSISMRCLEKYKSIAQKQLEKKNKQQDSQANMSKELSQHSDML